MIDFFVGIFTLECPSPQCREDELVENHAGGKIGILDMKNALINPLL
jgi:hypothetical protein